VNPGIRTATTGHAYSHPSNLFWKLLHSSGCTPRKCTPEEDGDMPYLYALGLTNIVTRPTKDAGELSKSEMDEGVSVLEEKIKRFRPESVCFVGKSIWESVWRVRRGRQMRKEEFKYGWQGEGESIGAQADEEGGWEGAWVFVATTTSGLAAGMVSTFPSNQTLFVTFLEFQGLFWEHVLPFLAYYALLAFHDPIE